MYVHKQTNHPPPLADEDPETTLHISTTTNYNLTFKNAVRTFKQHGRVQLVGEGTCATRTVNIAEDLKSRFSDVHQRTEMFCTEIEEVWAPAEGVGEELGLDSLVVKRSVPCVRVRLSREPVEGCVSFKREQQMNGEMVMLLKKEAKVLRGRQQQGKSRTVSESTSTGGKTRTISESNLASGAT